MTRPEYGGSTPPLTASIIHNRDMCTKCDNCWKSPRISLFLDQPDSRGLYSFHDFTVCLKCLRKAKSLLRQSKGTCSIKEYHCYSEDIVKKDFWDYGENLEYNSCTHCKNTPFFHPDKQICQLGDNGDYSTSYDLRLCMGCVNHLIGLLEQQYKG